MSIDLADHAALAAEASRRQARRAQGLPLTEPERVVVAHSQWPWPVLAIPLPRPTSLAREKDEQAAIVKLLHARGCRAESTSQYRRSKVALGIPDLWCWLMPIGRAAWFEVKSGADWSFSGPQLEWAERCLWTNTLYGCGDRHAAAAFLNHLGLTEA